jgi:hypothetical protein
MTVYSTATDSLRHTYKTLTAHNGSDSYSAGNIRIKKSLSMYGSFKFIFDKNNAGDPRRS